jgi:hypothetical protein
MPWVAEAIIGEVSETDVETSSSEEEIESPKKRKRIAKLPVKGKKKVGGRKTHSLELDDNNADFVKTTATNGYIRGVIDGIIIRRKIVRERPVGKGF